jgi:hypothetical protein
MNKKIITIVSVAVILALFLLGAIEPRTPMGQLDNLAKAFIEVVASLLALPVRLYAFLIYRDHGSWSSPILILLLGASGLMWGVIVERIVWIFSKWNTTQ